MSSPSILFVNQNYYPDFVSAGQRLQDLAEHLANDGFEVHVLCGRGGYEGESSRAPKRETLNGVHVRRVSTPSFGRATNVGRLVDYAAFYVQALARVLIGPRYDYVVTLTTPPLLGTLGLVVRALRGQPYGIWSMDLHPDAEKALGMLHEGQWITKLIDALNDRAHQRADFVVALGRYMKRRIGKKNGAADRVQVFPMWTNNMTPVPDNENPYLESLALEDKFVLLYSGNAGLAHRFDEVGELMQRYKNHPDIFFLFLGGGPRRAEIVRCAEIHGIDNFMYHDYIPRKDVKYFLSMADVHLLTLRHDMAGVAVPSKLYDSMAVGRPVLMVGPSESEPADTIRRGEFGYVIDPKGAKGEAGAHLADALERLYQDAERRRSMGKRGQALYEEEFKKEVVCAAWADFLRRR